MEAEFFNQTLNQTKALQFFEDYLSFIERYHSGQSESDNEESKLERILRICEELNMQLNIRQKAVVLLRLSEYVFIDKHYTEKQLQLLQKIGSMLNMDPEDLQRIMQLVTFEDVPENEHFLLIASQRANAKHRFIERSLNEGRILILHLKVAGMYFLNLKGSRQIDLNGVSLNPEKCELFAQGSILRGGNMHPVYFSDVLHAFMLQAENRSLTYHAENISYRFQNGDMGLHPLNLHFTQGNLVGIMGGSGAGKSTLLAVLNGSFPPAEGRILINGLDLNLYHERLEGMIGFVSQDDLLIEELSVFDNLRFAAKLSFASDTNEQIESRIERLLNELGLYEIRNHKVGGPLNKVISGGQRKRLNIALELIREPDILFLDEPTSGLSSKDSENIIDLLKSLSLKGKIVLTVIHQPSSQIFKVFDQLLLLDKGGYPVYLGHPVEAILYFRNATHQINAETGACACCGNVNPEQIFSIIEATLLNEEGLPTTERRIKPGEWYQYFIKHHAKQKQSEIAAPQDYKPEYKKPGVFKQFLIFLHRDTLSKIRNKQYVMITLLEAPLLGILLGWLTRYQNPGLAYSFQENRNLVAYLFISVIVSLFLGLIVSAGEILADRKIRKREQFLNLNKHAYYNSKVLILACISAIQAFLYVITGHSILGFESHYFSSWLMLFMVSLFANVLGLNISMAFRSAVTIYIVIPFLIIPQLLLSGLLVKYEDLNPSMASRSKVPWVGEVMAVRWAFEGLTTDIFLNSAYERKGYALEKRKIQAAFYNGGWWNEIERLFEAYKRNRDPEMKKILDAELSFRFQHHPDLGLYNPSKRSYEDLLASLKVKLIQQLKISNVNLDAFFIKIEADSSLSKQLRELKRKTYNNRLAELVQNLSVLSDAVFIERGRIFPGVNQIYFDPLENNQIRTHLYAPVKRFGSSLYPTYIVNVLVIFFMTLPGYLSLLTELPQRVMNFKINRSFRPLNDQ